MSRLKTIELGEGTPEQNQRLEMLKNAGKLLNIFKGMVNSTAAFDFYMAGSQALGKSNLDAKAREAIALVVGQVNQCDYCLAAHTMIGKGAGLSDEQVRGARLGHVDDMRLNGCVALAKKLAVNNGNVTDADLTAARDAGLSDGDIAEVTAAVAFNIFTNYFNHVNHTEVDLPKVPMDLE
ncbi:MAG: carboxymuconolactone decarboxylase family protein [Phycisphaerae bacterium]